MVIEIGVAKAKVLAKYLRGVGTIEAMLTQERAKLHAAIEGALAGENLPGAIVAIDEAAGTISTEDA